MLTIVFDNSHNKTILVSHSVGLQFFSALEYLSSGGRKVSLHNLQFKSPTCPQILRTSYRHVW